MTFRRPPRADTSALQQKLEPSPQNDGCTSAGRGEFVLPRILILDDDGSTEICYSNGVVTLA